MMYFGKDKFTTRRQKLIFRGGGGTNNTDYGKSIYQDLAETTPLTLGGTLAVTSSTTLNSSLAVTGTTALTGNATAAGSLTVTGQVIGTGVDQLIGKLIGANMNLTTDQTIPITRIGSQKYLITKILVTNASVSLATTIAAGGVYTAVTKGGTAIVGSGQAYTALTSSTVALDLTLAVNNTYTVSNLYFSLSNGHGSAATADIYVFGVILP